MTKILNPNGQRVMTEQEMAQAFAVQQYQATYLNLVSVFTADALRRQRPEDESWKPEEDQRKLDTDWICDTAKQVAVAAMSRLGINIV